MVKLKLAAKAAFEVVVGEDEYGLICRSDAGYTYTWNPRESSSDAFELAVKLRISIVTTGCAVYAEPPLSYGDACIVQVHGDHVDAAREAIVDAAALIGRTISDRY